MSDRPPARYFRTSISDQRRERLWEAVRAGLPSRRRRAPSFVPAVVLAAVVAIVGLTVGANIARAPVGAIDGAWLETGADERESLELGDGSQIVLEPSTKLQLERVSGREIRLKLQAGAVNASVTHVAGRPFTVVAEPVEVHVVGTHFRVERDASDGDVVVAVDEGRVSLARVDGKPVPSTLGAGERWSSQGPKASPSAPPELADAAPSSALGAHDGGLAPRRPLVSARFRQLWREGEFAAAFDELRHADIEVLVNSAGPQDVFAIAESARMSGHPHRAAKAFDAFRRRFRADPRAPLAALELGRLRLELGVPLQAKEAFEDAIALDPGGSFREDADARIVDALDAAGMHVECVAARDRYLAKYPSGLYEPMLKRRCR